MYCHTRHYYYYQPRCQKKKTKGDEHLVHVVIVILTLAHLHFDTLQKVLFQYVRESLYAMSTLCRYFSQSKHFTKKTR